MARMLSWELHLPTEGCGMQTNPGYLGRLAAVVKQLVHR
jgi:hypothetical protein